MSSLDGLHIPEWGGRARQEALARVKAIGRATNAPCVICQQPINYDLVYPHYDSCSVQHVKPKSRYPELTWDPRNHAPSHLQCNRDAGDRDVLPLGVTDL